MTAKYEPEGPAPGERYEHYKGNVYEVVCVGNDPEDGMRPYVVYTRYPIRAVLGSEEQPVWIRELSDWKSSSPDGRPRFRFVGFTNKSPNTRLDGAGLTKYGK